MLCALALYHCGNHVAHCAQRRAATAPTTKHRTACAQQAHAPPCKALHFPPCPSLHFIINWASPKHLPPKASFVVVKTFRFACESKAAGAGPRAQSCMAQTARQRAMMRATALHCKRQPPSRSTSRARRIARVESGRQQHSSRTRCLLPWHHGCSDASSSKRGGSLNASCGGGCK